VNRFIVLGEYEVYLTGATPEGRCGYINHIHGQTTPVGYLLMYREAATELRPEHWSVQVFIRMSLRYDGDKRRTDVVMDSLTPKWQSWHPDLPEAIGQLLLKEGSCAEPMAIRVNRFQERGGCEFGRTWCEEDDDL